MRPHVSTSSRFPHAREKLESELEYAKRDVDRCQSEVIKRIEAEKRAHSDVDFWTDELNEAVARRLELEGALRRLG